MFFFVLRKLRFFVAALRDNDSPRQMAYAVALGMVVGLTPKDNLTAVVLGVLLLTLRVNLAMAALSVVAFSWAGLLTDPVSHRIGLAVLSFEPLQSLYHALYNLPLAPWTGLNNTVVVGNLIIGLIAFYPVYRLSRHFSEKYGPPLRDRIQRYKVYQFLFGVNAVTRWRSE